MISLLIFILKNGEIKNKDSPLFPRLDKDGVLIPATVNSS